MEATLATATIILFRALLFLYQLVSPSPHPLSSIQTEFNTLLLVNHSDTVTKALSVKVSNLVCWHAFEVNGVLYEPKRAGWLSEMTELQRPLVKMEDVEDSGRTILSRTYESETIFFTNEEITQCAELMQETQPTI
ncbi:hypothetical protein BDV06DRAFT_228256 [Aspergillus oleicola]